MKSHRIKWLDFTKGFLIFSVLIYHSILTSGRLEPLTIKNTYVNNNANIITSIFSLFMMQGFFAISGYLYRPTRTIREYSILFYKKFTSIMIPGILFTLIGIISQDYHLLGRVIYRWYDLFICQYGDTWFLTTLFFVFIIVGLMDLLQIPLYFQLIMSMAFFLFQQYFSAILPNPCVVKNVMSGTPIQNISIYIIFFYLGYMFKKFRISIYSCLYILSIFVVSILGTFIYWKYIYLKTIVGFFSVIIIFIICSNFSQHNYLFRFLTKYGRFTLIIYLVHWPIVYFLIPKLLIHLHLTSPLINNVWFLIPCKIWFSLSVSLIICYIAKRNNIINFIFYPRKYISKLLLKTRLGKQFLTIK